MTAAVVLDAGTGGGKCVVFDAAGSVLGEHHEPWEYSVRIPNGIPFLKEFSFDPDHFWGLMTACVRTALAKAGIAAADVMGVACTSQREGCVFLDAAGKEIYAGPNLDARGFNEGLEILDRLGERLYQITGHSAPFIFPLARYLWFRKHGSGSVDRILMLNDWLTYRLTGEMCSEPSNATESMMFDLRRRDWSDEVLDAFGIGRDVLPPLRRCGERVGGVTAEAAAATGLLPGTPVFVGGADTQCSLLGAGAVAQDETGVTLGTTTPVQTVVAEPVFDPSATLWAGCHVLEDRWVLESNAGDTGDAYLWLLELVCGGRPRAELYELGERLARDAAPSTTMLFVGPAVFNISKMNLSRPGGILFPFPAMHVRPDRGAIVRGFLENLAFALRANLEQLAAVTGRPSRDVVVSGGLSRSAVAVQIIADALGLPLRVTCEPESAALGCAILVAAGAGHVGLEDARAAMTRHRVVSPTGDEHARYNGAYRKWREIDTHLDDLSL